MNRQRTGNAPASSQVLPADAAAALLVGRVWDAATGGPRPVRVDGEDVYDLFPVAPTVAALLERPDPVADLLAVTGSPRWQLSELLAATFAEDQHRSQLLTPVDLQVVKACGVTFVDSMIERVIEERCAGDPTRAASIRQSLTTVLSAEIGDIEPGTVEADRVKHVLLKEGLWSQYLEVGLGPDPEVFTKAPVLASVGTGARIGVASFSDWNNPEPELVLIADSRGQARGCTLGNDVNLRDVEGRSALLLGMAKDNNASSAIGPFIRLFHDSFALEDAREERLQLRVTGAADGYELVGENNVARLSRSFERLLSATHGDHHQYPDGFALYTGTLFAPVQDRGAPGEGFTHRLGDQVNISSEHLGALINEVGAAEQLPRWEFGIRSLMDYLQQETRRAED
ncbi:Fumarylacetoacetate (FAA) hydrolase family protein [Paramicrobacterium humi]|uniref:Fumarylacetoacetate (FAA) hydrolase family protein n=1 Tax=Paramicrobacterium humi TaxID=640635 RepID=A0A1H4K7V7_9MICO|nr:fumarylacetoacetate hydrolase family protein [Microbacterium humi]SEB54649.1 Fumarylacetoacetate (FAA) hydrolase family protein [Microbacterium humi]